jgi:hypothetical protein
MNKLIAILVLIMLQGCKTETMIGSSNADGDNIPDIVDIPLSPPPPTIDQRKEKVWI